MTKNACIDLQRTRKKLTPFDDIPLRDRTTEKTLPQQGIQQELKILERNLTEEEQLVFSMKVIDGLTFQEIADRLHKPLRTGHYRYQGILQKIDRHTALRAYWKEITRE